MLIPCQVPVVGGVRFTLAPDAMSSLPVGAGVVLEQHPGAGTLSPKDARVDLVVSQSN